MELHISKWQRNKAAGLCAQCGKVPPIEGKSKCAACKEEEDYNQATYRLRNRETLNKRARDRYWKRVQEGICVGCGKKPPIPGRKRCLACGIISSEASLKTRRKRLESK